MTTTTIQLHNTTAGRVVVDLDQVFRRWLQDVIDEATVAYWRRRADQLAEIGTPWADEAAAACRAKAVVLAGFPDQPADLIVCRICGTPTSPWSCSCGATRIGGAA